MANTTIEGWSVSRKTDGDEPVWYLTKDDRQITVRGQAGITDDAMVEAATVSANQANLAFAKQSSDDDAASAATDRLKELETAHKVARLRRQADALLGAANGEKE
jgi:hypothetical protein